MSDRIKLQATSLTQLRPHPPRFTPASLAFLLSFVQVGSTCLWDLHILFQLPLDSFQAYTSFQPGLSQMSLYHRGLPWLPAKIASPSPSPSLYPLTMLRCSSYSSPLDLVSIYFSVCLLSISPHQTVSPVRAGILFCSLQYPQCLIHNKQSIHIC